MGGALRELGLAADMEQTRAVMNKYDTDRSGTLELPEFRQLVKELKSFKGGAASPARPSDDVAATFARADVDNSGGIDVGELHGALRELGLAADMEQTRAVMNKYD